MSPITIALIAVSMSVDAFAASLAKGAALHKPEWREALRTGTIFGLVETATPLIGWAAGLAASSFVEAIDHWIAFGLLAIVGGKMIYESLKGDHATRERPQRHSLAVLVVTALATSLDALAVGVSFAFLNVNILAAAGAIGLSTFILTTIGVMIGRVVGTRLGSQAEFLGGICLIAIGCFILAEHTIWA
jgi:putative Mn2+ efflux pump MntP